MRPFAVCGPLNPARHLAGVTPIAAAGREQAAGWRLRKVVVVVVLHIHGEEVWSWWWSWVWSWVLGVVLGLGWSVLGGVIIARYWLGAWRGGRVASSLSKYGKAELSVLPMALNYQFGVHGLPEKLASVALGALSWGKDGDVSASGSDQSCFSCGAQAKL